MTVDLNADVGEGTGDDAAVMDVVTSVNVACGVHAGSPALMAATLAVARNRGLAVGAHPGYADRVGGGRRDLDVSSADITALVADQIQALGLMAIDPVAKAVAPRFWAAVVCVPLLTAFFVSLALSASWQARIEEEDKVCFMGNIQIRVETKSGDGQAEDQPMRQPVPGSASALAGTGSGRA